MLQQYKSLAPFWGLALFLILTSCGKTDTPNVADPYANLTGLPLGFDVTPPAFELDADGNQKGLDAATTGACGNILLQWSNATDDVSTPDNIRYLIYQSTVSSGENLSVPTYPVPASSTDRPEYLVTGLSPGTEYFFVVRAEDQAGNISVVDPNHLVERSATTAGTRAGGNGPALYCPGGYAQELADFTGNSIANATSVTFTSLTPAGTVTTIAAVSASEIRVPIPPDIQSGPVQITPPGISTADRFLYFPPPINISSDPTTSSSPAVAVSGQTIAAAWIDSFQGGQRVLFSYSTDGGADFSAPVQVSSPGRYSSDPQIAFGPGATPPVYLVWSDLDTSSNNSEIYFSSASASLSGYLFSPPVDLSYDAGSSLHPALLSSGNLVSVAWDDNSVFYGLNAIWGSGFEDVYAVGSGGRIYHSSDQGKSWIREVSGVSGSLNGIWGSSPGDVFAVGDGGTILHSNNQGSSWSSMTSAYSATLRTVWGSGPGDVYAGGSGGTILHFDGTSWSLTAAVSSTIGIHAIWGSGSGDVYAVGDGGTILHSNNQGISWSTTAAASPTIGINAIWGSGATDIYAVGDAGLILHFDGSSWTPENSDTSVNLSTVFGAVYVPNQSTTTVEDIYAGGGNDKIVKKSGTFPLSPTAPWNGTSVEISGSFTVSGLWGSVTPNTVIYGVDGNGPIFQWNGSNWQYQNPDATLGEIFVRQSQDGGNTFSQVAQISGALQSNHQASNPALAAGNGVLTAAWSEVQSDTVAVTSLGNAVSSSYGSTGSQVTPVTGQSLNGVVWTGEELVAVGASGTVATSPDGLAWTIRNSTISGNLNGIAGPGTNLVAVGDSGTLIASQDGAAWSLLPPAANTQSVSLKGVAWSGTRFVAVGSGGTVLTSSFGSTWSPQATYTPNSLNAVNWSGVQFIVVGASGTILSSVDGVTWSSEGSGTSNALYGIIWSGSRYVAVGAAGTIVYSLDGATWNPANPVPTGNDLKSVAWDGARFMAGGNGGVVLASPDGANWTLLTSPVPQPQSINALAVAGANGRIDVSRSPGIGSFSVPEYFALPSAAHAAALSMTPGGGSIMDLVWQEASSRSNQIKMIQFPSAGPLGSPAPKLLSAQATPAQSGTASQPAAVYASGTGTLVVAWVDTLQQKKDNGAIEDEIFLISSPDGGVTFTPPSNFSSPYRDSSDAPVLATDGMTIYMVWQQQMPPTGPLPQNGETFFSHF